MKKLIKLFKIIKAFIIKLFRKQKENENEEFFIKFDNKYSDSKSGGDILPGPVPVPTSDVLYYTFYENTDENGNQHQWLVTKITTKFFFIIPFSYDEYIIEFIGKKYDNPTAEDVIKEIDEAEHYNQRGKIKMKVSEGKVHFEGYAYDIYELGDNDYYFLEYYK